jgi:predicted metalloprotease
MRWRTGRRSSNVEDRRSSGGGMRFPFPMGGGGRAPRGGGKIGVGTVVIALIAMFLFDINPLELLGGGGIPVGYEQPSTTTQSTTPGKDDEMAQFVSVVLADTEDTWDTIFKQHGSTYKKPKLVLYRGSTRSACGYGQAAMGPFYCPGDHKIYIDLSFYEDLKNRHGAPGDFAQAYVIAHEVGHHVQNITGTSDQVRKQQARAGKSESNELSVRQELQADCYAGVWANHAHNARNILEQGDIEEALGAANAIGDDRLQKQSRGYVTPDSFTHGSSEQRMRWFMTGLKSGELESCNTFATGNL